MGFDSYFEPNIESQFEPNLKSQFEPNLKSYFEPNLKSYFETYNESFKASYCRRLYRQGQSISWRTEGCLRRFQTPRSTGCYINTPKRSYKKYARFAQSLEFLIFTRNARSLPLF